jgi:murein DD-endopeptidase MepM/ murein hydrolase activator NlpD
MINLIIVAIILIIAILFAIFRPNSDGINQASFESPAAKEVSVNPNQAAIAQLTSLQNNSDSPTHQQRTMIEPIRNFYERITKKTFGMYITPETSPVQPDKFTGFHTGVDVEYDEVVRKVPVKAIADGTVIVSRFASGYGGVVMIRHNINDQYIVALYGHLGLESVLPQGTVVRQGDTIGILGDGHSRETDGARKHLHFSILKKKSLDMRGYVQNEQDLEGWYDPLEFYDSF